MGYQCINVDINGILVGIVGIIYVFMGYFHVILPSCKHLDVENPLFVDHVPKENHCGFFGSTTIGLVRWLLMEGFMDQSLAHKRYIHIII